ncbi:hypothetical protein ACRRTK_001564 [Alexandromys fortis]
MDVKYRSSRDMADHPFLKGHTRWREGADDGVLLDIGILQMGGECWLSMLGKRKLLQVHDAGVTCITRREATDTAFLPVTMLAHLVGESVSPIHPTGCSLSHGPS